MAIFKGKNIRRTLHKNEWFFSLVDICGALTDSVDAGGVLEKIETKTY